MAKAFTAEEKKDIREKLLETALDLFHDKGTKSLSISELTRRVGIAQGSFYNFWKDKESLIIDLIAYRSSQKLDIVEKNFSDSLAHPIEFLTDLVYRYSIDLMNKVKTQPIYRDAFKIFDKKSECEMNRIENLYGEFLFKLTDYWKQNNAVTRVDERGLSNAFIGSFVLCSNCYQFADSYFNDILKSYIGAIVSQYIEL